MRLLRASITLLTIISAGCLMPRIDTFLVQGTRFQAMPQDWRSLEFAVHEFKGEPDSARSKVLSNEVEAQLRKAGFGGIRRDGTAPLVVFWSAGNASETHDIPGSRISRGGGGTATSTSVVSGDYGSALVTTTTDLPGQYVTSPTINRHTITAYTTEIAILDTRKDPFGEAFRGRCLIKAIDQPVGQPFDLAISLILEGFPGAPASTISKELDSLTTP